MTLAPNRQPIDESKPIVIVGSGPVGMTLALDLGARGVPVVVLEQSETTTDNPRCNTTNARSMEYFRKLGLADQIRRSGLPVDQPTDVVYTTSITGYELARFPFSTTAEIHARTAPELVEWPTPEPQHRISQIFLEPILAAALERYASVRVMRGVRATGVEQDALGATVTAIDLDGGSIRINASYVVGCDGGSSVVRKSIGASLHGDAEVGQRRLSIYFESDALSLPGPRSGWWYWWQGAHYHGSFIQLDGRSLYLCHARVPDGQDLATADPDQALREAIGYDVPHRKLDVVRWTPRRLIADKFREGRVLLAGDAAHVWLPMGGFGMNTGISDAVALGWRIAAIRDGWGTDSLLDDYEFERHSVGVATSQAAKKIGADLEAITRDPRLREDSATGRRLRGEVGELIRDVDRKQWYSMGVQFGAQYFDSLGLSQSTPAPRESAIGRIDHYEPSVEPGSRFPHFWLTEYKDSIFDHLGQGLTLVVVGQPEESDVQAFITAARDDNFPLTVLRVPNEGSSVYRRRLILVRPDWYVAWSGDTAPTNITLMLRSLLGFHRPTAESQPKKVVVEGIAL